MPDYIYNYQQLSDVFMTFYVDLYCADYYSKSAQQFPGQFPGTSLKMSLLL